MLCCPCYLQIKVFGRLSCTLAISVLLPHVKLPSNWCVKLNLSLQQPRTSKFPTSSLSRRSGSYTVVLFSHILMSLTGNFSVVDPSRHVSSMAPLSSVSGETVWWVSSYGGWFIHTATFKSAVIHSRENLTNIESHIGNIAWTKLSYLRVSGTEASLIYRFYRFIYACAPGSGPGNNLVLHWHRTCTTSH